MGEFQPATHAYMIYTDENGVMAGDPQKPTIPSIYMIPADEVAAFKRLHDVAGAVWVPVYSMHKWNDSIRLKKEKMKDAEPQREPSSQEEV